MGSNRTNPKKIPCSRADVEKARREGRLEGHEQMATVMLITLMDYYGWSPEGSDTCEHCGSTWAKVFDDGRLEHIEAAFCPNCGNPERGGIVSSKSLIELWTNMNKTLEAIESGRIKISDVRAVLDEYGFKINVEG